MTFHYRSWEVPSLPLCRLVAPARLLPDLFPYVSCPMCLMRIAQQWWCRIPEDWAAVGES